MQGSVRKRGDKWYYSFELAKVDGKRRRVERVGGRTKKEALAAMRKAIEEYQRAGQLFDESGISVSDYFDYWYKNYVLINLKFNTQQNYKGIIDRHLKPALGTYHLKNLSPAVLQEFVNKKYLSGLSKSMLSNIIGVLSKGLTMAVYPYRFTKDNPMQYVKAPKYKTTKGPEDLKTITQKEFKTIINRFPRGSSFYLPLLIGFHTGMRAAEVCGLTKDCVDLAEKKIKVEKILIYKGKGVHEFGTPKTQSSVREITISDFLAEEIRLSYLDQKKNALKYGPHYTHNNHVCTKENGEAITTNSLKYLSRVVNYELGINFNFHSLRHTHASMLLAAGANIKAIQVRLGHAEISTTLDTYAHVTEDLEKSTAVFLENLAD